MWILDSPRSGSGSDLLKIRSGSTRLVSSRAIYFDSRKELGQTKVLVWAHSMGAWVSGHMMASTDLSRFERTRLILEAPSNHIEGEVVASKGCVRKILLRCFGDPNSEFR